jgi:segregation and condensation protein B
MDELDVSQLAEERPAGGGDAELKAVLEAIVYVTDEPLSAQQIAAALEKPIDVVKRLLDELAAEYAGPEHGLSIREIAGGYKMATKPEHHEAVRAFVKKLTPPLKLSLAALETLAVIAYKQPVTAPEIMEIRGVQGAGVLKTLLDRKLITEAGRKKVVGQPILYKTTKEFLVQFGLKDLSELPTLKEFEEIGRMAVSDEPEIAPAAAAASAAASDPGPEAAANAASAGGAAESAAQAGSTSQQEPDRDPEPVQEPEPEPPPVEEPPKENPPEATPGSPAKGGAGNEAASRAEESAGGGTEVNPDA